MIATLALALAILVFGYLGIVMRIYVRQRSLQYFPTYRGPAPQSLGLAGFSAETIVTPDGEHVAAWYAAASSSMPTILFLHGNAGEIAGRAARLAFYRDHGFGVLALSYRGFGSSTGRISERGLVTDALAAHDWLVEHKLEPDRIVVVGESLGAAVAVQLAARRAVAAVALEAPFASAADIAADIYWWLPVRLLMKDPFHSRDVIAGVKAPLLIQHGDGDIVIPLDQGRRLYAMANEPKQLVVIAGAGHEIVDSPDVWARELAFFRGRLPVQ